MKRYRGMFRINMLLIGLCAPCRYVAGGPNMLTPWTRMYNAHFDNHIMLPPSQLPIVILEKINIPSFNQIIFSWNALRPLQGYFSFYVQVRDKTTKKWGVLHHMYDWGLNKASSYKSVSDGMSCYEYVRLEMAPHRLADAFRIKVQSKDGAPLSLIRSATVAASCYNLFEAENSDLYNLYTSVTVNTVPKIAQFALDHEQKDKICSPVSLTMLLQSLGYYVAVEKVIEKSYDNGLKAFGSWPFNIAHAFECSGGNAYFYVCRLNSFDQVYTQLKKNIPVVVSVRGPLPGAERPYAQGHLLVIVGWDQEKKEVICHDPAFDDPQKTLKYYPIKPFLAAWERSRRLAYMTMHR